MKEIQENTTIDQWKHIKSKQNRADEASRGMNARELLESQWITRSAFLWGKETPWLTSKGDDQKLQQDDPEVKSIAMSTTGNVVNVKSNSEILNLADRVVHFSDW